MEVPNLSHDAKLKIVERERPGRQANSDSDDECIPDPPIQPSFSQSDLAVVQSRFDQLCQHYPTVIEIGFFNALGKIFLSLLGAYVNMCTSDRLQYLYLPNTSTGVTHPGAMHVRWSLLAKQTRVRSQQERVVQVFERYADFVVYDRINCINTVVAEVKQDEMEATESQNNEQMVELWSVGQIAMLGLEFKSTSVVPKILAVDNNALRMFYLNPLNLRDSSGLSELTRL